jgi:hypothetical protein
VTIDTTTATGWALYLAPIGAIEFGESGIIADAAEDVCQDPRRRAASVVSWRGVSLGHAQQRATSPSR